MNSIYVMYYAGTRPFSIRADQHLELFNEVCLMILFYHGLIFSDFVPDLYTQFQMGVTFISILVFMVMINIINLIIETFNSWQRQRRMDEMAKFKVEDTEEVREM